MKVNYLIISILIQVFVGYASAQYNSAQSAWFVASELYPKIWRIDDHNAVNIYLVEGNDSALLIDTGMGAADLRSFIQGLTRKPLIVVNTHGHADHTGSDYQFKTVYISPADSAEARASNILANREIAAGEMLRSAIPSDEEKFHDKEILFRMLALKDGYTFQLGGRQIRVIETPGHTPGSICLLDVEDKLLFTGDNDNTAVWLFLPNCLPLSEYLKSLQSLANINSKFTTLLPGHGIPKPADFINDQISCVKSILDHSCTPELYETFAGKAMLCKFGRASVAYDPDKLNPK